MAIMFAGGMTIGVSGFMPQTSADTSVSDGMLTISSEYIQGAAILEVVINDPNFSSTTDDLSNGPDVTISGTDYIASQATNGKWYAYFVDNSTSILMDRDSTGMEFGHLCTKGLGTNHSANIVASGTSVWAEVPRSPNAVGTTALKPQAHDASGVGGTCIDADGGAGTLNDAVASVPREKMSDAVLTGAPTLSNHDDAAATAAGVDMGQRSHSLNASGYGSWPFIFLVEFDGDNVIEYGSDSINMEYGNTDDETTISLANANPADQVEVHVTISDPALNIDPTGVDAWMFKLDGTGATPATVFANNGSSNTALTADQLADAGFVDNGRLTTDNTAVITGKDDVVMTESAVNSAVFESFNINGVSEITTIDEAGGDKKTVFSYGGDSLDMIITYNDASISMENPNGSGNWLAANAATITVSDPDLNKNPLEQEELSIGNSTHVIPTIKVGTPLTLSTGNNACLNSTLQAKNAAVHTCRGNIGHDQGSEGHSFAVHNVTDTSERLGFILSAADDGIGGTTHTHTWLNITTGHTRQALVNLPGTVVLSYDVSGPADLLGSTSIDVYVTDAGTNASDNAGGVITIETAGNVKSGVYDLDDGNQWIRSTDETRTQTFGSPQYGGSDNSDPNSGWGSNVSVAFQFTHPASGAFDTLETFAIAVDFCNFDQNNGSNVHNCIYRVAAEETGDDTGVFEGTVEYVMLTNSSSLGTTSGEHDGNDHVVSGFLNSYANTDELVVVVMDAVDGTDAIRVTYNDTDALQQADEIGAQLDTHTHTASISLDADTYEADDMATITITDPDLNQDSSIRDTYENSSTTFKMTVTGSDGTTHQPFATKPMTVIETTVDSGVFVGTFKVPDYNGQDIELTYYEAKDNGGNTVELYDVATVSSNSGTIALDRSVYPVPWATYDLRTGDDNKKNQSEAGNVTLTLTVEDADFTSDTLTTASTTAAGTIQVMLVEGSSTSTCFTAGSTRAAASSSNSIEELGPLTEIEMGTSVYEVEFTLDEVQQCGPNMRTVTSGDIIQVSYTDASNDAGSSVTVYDSSTFEMRTGSLSVDKDVYVLGSDMVVTLTDPDLNVDAGSIDSYAMSLIEWDSDADSSELLNGTNNFTNNPSKIQETGEDTGVFQTVVTLPTSCLYGGDSTANTCTTIDYGETVTLTYVDVGISGETSTEDDTSDREAYFSISNFGAIVELNKAVYNWTELVLITITAPDHNVNSASEEQIGTTDLPIQVTSRAGKMCSGSTYFADESGPDTGVFEAEVQLSGFSHTLSSMTTAYTPATTTCGSANDSGIMKTASQTDGISVSYEYNDGSVVVASASIAWNIGEAGFDSSSVSASGSSVISVTDPDENTDDDVIDVFSVDIFSDSDSGGFQLTLNETDEDTGVFEGTVYFTNELATSGDTLRVSEGDTVTAEYTDETLPEPYTTDDDLTIAATLTIGTAFPPLERAPAANARVVDAFGASVSEVSVDQQVQIAADVANGQSKDQAFAYLVQVQDSDGVTVSLAWITGSLTGGQSMSPALSWTPDASGSYTATVFVWESVDNPTALSPTVSVDIDVV
jgi:hypothetical protein